MMHGRGELRQSFLRFDVLFYPRNPRLAVKDISPVNRLRTTFSHSPSSRDLSGDIMTPVFWGVVALDAALFVILVILGITDSGPNDGGREMAMIFSVFLPAIIIGGAVLLFVKSESSLWRTVALLIVAGPGLLIGGSRVRSAFISSQIRQNNAGSGYFSGRALKRAAEAVVRGDLAAIDAIDPSVDLNTKGDAGMTLMELAVSKTVLDSTPQSPRLAVVRALLSRGADPNPGLEEATHMTNGVLSVLLDAHANPGYVKYKDPVVFQWLNVMTSQNFSALLDHGLDVNLRNGEYGSTLIVALAENDRWNLVLLLMDRGADVARDLERLNELVQSREESTSDRPPEMKADIARVKARLKTMASKPVSP
jgi:hypothetical protein